MNKKYLPDSKIFTSTHPELAASVIINSSPGSNHSLIAVLAKFGLAEVV